MEGFDDILRSATRGIADRYFRLPVAHGAATFRERVYCYELYHQIRSIWPAAALYSLNGEVDKGGHPFLEEHAHLAPVMPDFLIHDPGSMDRNFAVMDVKHCLKKRKAVKKDLQTLSAFVRDWGYRRAIYLIYGGEAEDCRKRIGDAAGGLLLEPIELWHHAAAGIQSRSLGHVEDRRA